MFYFTNINSKFFINELINKFDIIKWNRKPNLSLRKISSSNLENRTLNNFTNSSKK